VSRIRVKRLHRVTATDRDGLVTFRRDYQSPQAAQERAARLLDGWTRPVAPYGDEEHVEPAARVTIQPSEPVQFTADPVPYRTPDDEGNPTP